MQQPSPESILVTGQKASPDEVSWLEFERKEQQETPKRLEETAKYLSGLISVTYTIFLQANAKAFDTKTQLLPFRLAILFWLIAILITLVVVFPFFYGYTSQSAQSIQQTYQRIIRIKFWLLVLGTGCFVTALICLALLYFE